MEFVSLEKAVPLCVVCSAGEYNPLSVTVPLEKQVTVPVRFSLLFYIRNKLRFALPFR